MTDLKQRLDAMVREKMGAFTPPLDYDRYTFALREVSTDLLARVDALEGALRDAISELDGGCCGSSGEYTGHDEYTLNRARAALKGGSDAK